MIQLLSTLLRKPKFLLQSFPQYDITLADIGINRAANTHELILDLISLSSDVSPCIAGFWIIGARAEFGMRNLQVFQDRFFLLNTESNLALRQENNASYHEYKLL
ncbi:hypothetical protein RYX36_011200 [Vicia faba]